MITPNTLSEQESSQTGFYVKVWDHSANEFYEQWIDTSEPLKPLPAPEPEIWKNNFGEWVTRDGFCILLGLNGKPVFRKSDTRETVDIKTLPDEIRRRLDDDYEDAHNREFHCDPGESMPSKKINESTNIVARPLGDFENRSSDDPDELLKDRYLCRGGGLLLCAPTGIGKSVFVVQLATLFALELEAFGLVPARPIRSLIIQAENDDGDIAEMRDGIFRGLHLDDDDRSEAGQNIIVVREDSKTGMEFFCDTVKPLLENYKPDLLIIDPALAYIGGESNSQKDVGGFLRNGLNPLLREFGCGCIVVHHTNKPPTGKEKSQWQAGDFAYLGAGSAEWANWARAVLSIRSIGSHEVFELNAGKRGSRLDWKDKDGGKVFSKPIAHAKEPGVICWREVDPDEIEQGGRPKSVNDEEMLSVLPPEGLSTTDWQMACKEECGISERTFFRERKALLKVDRIIRSKATNKWQPVTKRA